jgi:glycosyltransferase involved in cell wall biosynthesis
MFHEWAVARGVPAYEVPLPFPSKRTPLPFLRSLWRLRRIARRHKIQLIHCNEQNIYPIGQYLARMLRVPVVVSIHFTMGREYCEWAFREKRSPDRMFFVSRGNLQACRDNLAGIVSDDRWRVLYNGLDLHHFAPDPYRRNAFRAEHGLGDSIAIGVACALRPRKQLEHLLEAAAQVHDDRLRIVIAGGPVPGDEAYARHLIEKAKRDLGSRLVYLGHLEELRGFYNGLDVFVNTSQEEACSISVIESLACGCPILGYPSKSVDDQILPGGGEIVAQDDVPELVQALRRWLIDPKQLAGRRTLARRLAEDRFDIEKISEELWREYEQLVANNGARMLAPVEAAQV